MVRGGLGFLLMLGSCGPKVPDPYSEEYEIHLVRIEPQSEQVFLNQKLLFVFDKPLDPESVTERTLRILSSDGSPVPGKRVVRGSVVEFIPIPPLDPDLDDGSFRPGERYRLWMAHYPKPLAIYGSKGELLIDVPEKTWRAVDPKKLPEDYSSPLLPHSPLGPFVLLPPPEFVLEGGEPVLRLRFNHSLYPPSVRPSAFRILSRSGLVREIPIAKTRILPRAGPGGFGSTLEISPAWDLEPGLYRLFLLPGIRGVQDDRLQPLKIWEIQTGSGLPKLRDLSREGAWVEFLVDKKIPPKIYHDFSAARPGLRSLSELKGTHWDPEGTLQWGPGGLFLPDLHWEHFQSLGELKIDKTQILKAGERLPGSARVLPGGGKPWDFDRIVLGPEARLVLCLERDAPTVLRVAGRMDLAGRIQVLLPRGLELPELGARETVVGDPHPSWPARGGQLRCYVGGWLRARGPIEVEMDGEEGSKGEATKGTLGFLWVRGPAEATEAFRSRLQVWVQPPIAGPPSLRPSPPQLPGSWVAISPWLAIPTSLDRNGKASQKSLKGILVGIPMERRDLSFLLQLRGGGGELGEWRPPGGLSGLGAASYIRLAVLWTGGVVTPDPLMRDFGIR